MKKNKICKNVNLEYAEYNHETRESTAILNTDIGDFKGLAVAAADETPDRFTGPDYAIRRAYVKYLETKRKHARQEYKGALELYKYLKTINFDASMAVFGERKIKKFLYLKRKDIRALEDEIVAIEAGIVKQDKERDFQIEKLKKKKLL